MKDGLFQVKPVTGYQGAQYPGPRDVADEAVEERTHPVVLILAMLLVLGIAVGLIGCYLRTDYPGETTDPDGGPDPDGDPPDPGCDDGALRCADSTTLQLCDAGEWTDQACEEYCQELDGPFAYSLGCDEDADDPCQCQYDTIEGGAPQCTPDDMYCVDEYTLSLCDETGSELIQSCDEYCSGTYGPGYYSLGCDLEAEDPCQCEYGMVDGFEAACSPGEVFCMTDQLYCDGTGYEPVDCAQYCVTTYGADSSSAGCDSAADDPCLCVSMDQGSK